MDRNRSHKNKMMKRTRDREILALSLLVKTLRPLDLEARKRAIDYALNRLKEEDVGNTTTREMTIGELLDEERKRLKDQTPEVSFQPSKPEAKDATLLSPRKTQAQVEREEFEAASARELKKNL